MPPPKLDPEEYFAEPYLCDAIITTDTSLLLDGFQKATFYVHSGAISGASDILADLLKTSSAGSLNEGSRQVVIHIPELGPVQREFRMLMAICHNQVHRVPWYFATNPQVAEDSIPPLTLEMLEKVAWLTAKLEMFSAVKEWAHRWLRHLIFDKTPHYDAYWAGIAWHWGFPKLFEKAVEKYVWGVLASDIRALEEPGDANRFLLDSPLRQPQVLSWTKDRRLALIQIKLDKLSTAWESLKNGSSSCNTKLLGHHHSYHWCNSLLLGSLLKTALEENLSVDDLEKPTASRFLNSPEAMNFVLARVENRMLFFDKAAKADCNPCTGFWETYDEERLPSLDLIGVHFPEKPFQLLGLTPDWVESFVKEVYGEK